MELSSETAIDSTAKALDVDFMRRLFPTFEEPLAAKTAFFENAGGSYVAGSVLDRLTHFYRYNKVQPYGSTDIQRHAGEQMDAGRETMAQLLGIDSACLTVGASTTQNINTLAIACAPLVDSDTQVIVTEQDHEANIGAWQRLCQRQGATLQIWPVDKTTGELSLDDLDRLLSSKTAILCLTHSSNIVGSINPVAEVIERCRISSTRVVVDGVSFAPHQWPDIPALQADAYCFSSYKTYATHMGIMYVSADFAADLDPQCHFFNRHYDEKKFDSSGPDHASIAALAGLGEFFNTSYTHHFGNDDASPYQQAQAMAAIMNRHEVQLGALLLDGLRDMPLRVIGKPDMQQREANVALISKQFSSSHLCEHLAKHDVAVGHGDFYARRLIEALDIEPDDGVLRVSLAHYNTQAEVLRLLDALRTLH